LFLIYVNDIANAVPNEKVRLYADDTNLLLARNTAPSVADAADNTMLKLNNWFLANKLSLNTDKTFYMVFPPDTLLQTSSQSWEKFPQAKKINLFGEREPFEFRK